MTPYLSSAIKSVGPQFSKRVKEVLSSACSEMLNGRPSLQGFAAQKPPIVLTSADMLDITPPSLTRSGIPMGDGTYMPGIRRVGELKIEVNHKPRIEEQIREAFIIGEPTDFLFVLTEDTAWKFKGFVTGFSISQRVMGGQKLIIKLRPSGPQEMKTASKFVQDSTDPCFGLAKLTITNPVPHHPNCRCLVPDDGFIHGIRRKGPVSFTVNFERKEKQPVKIRNRFYVASPSVTKDLEQAQDNLPDQTDLATHHQGAGKWTRKKLADVVAQAEVILAQDPQKDHVAIVQIVRVVRRKVAPIIVEVVR